ncbi:MAG TPA: hypothetical protein VF174_11835 [Micromonosporaceae bacterium]
MGYPFDLPASMPSPGGAGWNVPLEANLGGLRDRARIHESTYGVPLDSFDGADDDAKLGAAMAYAAAQTRPPAIILGNSAYSFSGGPYPYYPGLRLVGSLGHTEREFQTTGPHTVVTVGGSALFSVPSGGVRSLYISGIQFRAASGSVHFQQPVTDLSSGPIIQDGNWERCGWVGFNTVMHARHLRCSIERTYCNNSTDTPFKLAGADNYYWTTGQSYLSSTAQSASSFYVWFTHMSKSIVGPIFITPERATAVRIDGSFGGLVFQGTIFDSANRTATTACQGAAVLITGGRGMVFRDCWFYNNCVNPSATGRSPVDKGQVYIRGSAADILFNGCSWSGEISGQGWYVPAGTPAIYAATGVTGVKVVAPIAPNNGPKLLQHQQAGIITRYAADDWTLAVA